MKKIAVLLIASLSLEIAVISFAQETSSPPKALSTTSGQQKRSTIVEAHGYVFLSEDKTIRQLREEALAEAKRKALEQARTYIKSFTQVENYTLTYDLIQSETEGYLKILESKDYGIESDNRYHYWIKAEIEYELKKPETNIKSSSILHNPKAPLTVDVWTEKASYIEGEEIRIFLKGNKPFYARVVYVDAQGQIVQLLPNKYRQLNFFDAGTIYTIPGPGDRFKLTVRPPYGREQVIVYASSAPQAALTMTEIGNGLYQYRGDLAKLGMKVRGVEISKSTNGVGGVEFYEASWNLVTKSREE